MKEERGNYKNTDILIKAQKVGKISCRDQQHHIDFNILYINIDFNIL